MKLVNRKTRKAIEKTVRKALKRQGPALVAAVASGLASSLATLAKTEAPGKDGKSNLANIAERVAEAMKPNGHEKKHHGSKKKHRRHDHDPDMAQQSQASLT
jgi:hypothetical protein